MEQNAFKELTEDIQQDPNFLAAWMVRDGNSPPQPPDPPLFSTSPPKLDDPTGKDLLGAELALLVIRRLLQRSGAVALEVCRGMWYLTAAKHKQADLALQRVDKHIKSEIGKLEARLAERLSGAIFAGAAEVAIRQMNEGERQAFRANCNQQRQEVLNNSAWEFRRLLWLQQQMLTKLSIPGFDGPTLDNSSLDMQCRVCAYLHSAFYLRKRIGEKLHAKTLKSQEERLLKSGVQVMDIASIITMQANNFNMAQQQQQQQQKQQYGAIQLPPPPPPLPMGGGGMQYIPGQPQYIQQQQPPQQQQYGGSPMQAQQPNMMYGGVQPNRMNYS